MTMKLRISHPGILLCLVVAAGPADAPAADSAAGSAPAMRLPVFEARYECHGVCQMGQTLYASIRNAVTGESQWCELNRSIGGWTLTDISPHRVILRDRRSGKEQILNNTAAAPAENPAEPDAKRSLYSKAWINSEENPMLLNMQPLPIEVVREWPNLTKEQKEEIVGYYRKHGWQLIGAEIVNGSSTFHWENIYEAERRAAVSANRREFEQTLTDEQRVAYDAIKRTPMMHVDNGKLTPEQEVEGKRRAAAAAQFKASLSPGQLALQKGIPDFTKRLGVPDAK
jgi:hypothetical protein